MSGEQTDAEKVAIKMADAAWIEALISRSLIDDDGSIAALATAEIAAENRGLTVQIMRLVTLPPGSADFIVAAQNVRSIVRDEHLKRMRHWGLIEECAMVELGIPVDAVDG